MMALLLPLLFHLAFARSVIKFVPFFHLPPSISPPTFFSPSFPLSFSFTLIDAQFFSPLERYVALALFVKIY